MLFLATDRIHSLTNELYEELFDSNGKPRLNQGFVANLISAFRTKLAIELDLIRESVGEFNEKSTDANKFRQTSILDKDWESRGDEV
jgi:hypothetical protein